MLRHFLLTGLFGSIGILICHSQNVVFNDSNSRMQVTSPSGVVSDSTFTEVADWCEGRCFVNKGDLYGYIDTFFNEITPFIYDVVSSFHNGFAIVQRDSQFTFINKQGSEICPPNFQSVRPFFGTYAPVMVANNSDRWGLIDTSGKIVYSCELDYPPTQVYPDFIRISFWGKWGVLDDKLNVKHSFEYDYIDECGRAYLNNRIILLGR